MDAAERAILWYRIKYLTGRPVFWLRYWLSPSYRARLRRMGTIAEILYETAPEELSFAQSTFTDKAITDE